MPISEIQTQHLSFSYLGKEETIHDLNLNVPKGSIYCFLGHNGAGKSTTIQLLLGLLSPSKGVINLFGKERSKLPTSTFNKIGALIEAPALYGHLSAEENLVIAAKYRKIGRQRIDEVLTLVGLNNASRKKVKNFSMGMKQRLGLGLALLHDPSLIFLDEPTNGLDPQGIIEIREIIQNLQQNEGKTIFISSHLLAEIELIATHVGIIKAGKQIFEGKITSLQSSINQGIQYSITTPQLALATSLLKTKFPNLTTNKEQLFITVSQQEDINIILQFLVNNNIPIYEVKQTTPTLEHMFLDITRNTSALNAIAA